MSLMMGRWMDLPPLLAAQHKCALNFDVPAT